MATYIPGVTDYIPQIQPFVPDYNYLSNVLQTKQSRYDQANKQIGDFYGKLLYSPLTRTDNIEAREKFFKSVDTQLKKLSGIDLSLQQNQDYAMNIFKPLYEDKNIVKDMAWTKNRDFQLDRGESFRSCSDEEKCGGGFWEGGIDYIKYKTEEYKNATPEEALSFEDPKYTPSVNVYDKAVKDLNAAGFKIKMQYSDGRYIYTDTNGNDMIPTLSSYLQSNYQNNPQIRSYYDTQAYLGWKQFSASQPQGTPEDQLLESYKQSITLPAVDNLKKEHGKAQKTVTELDSMIETYRDYIKKNGVLGNEEDLIQAFVSLNKQKEMATATATTTGQAVAHANNAVNLTGNKKAYLDNLIKTAGMNMLNIDTYRGAKAYAELTKEHTMAPDSYGVAAYSSELALNNQLTMADVNHQIWKDEQLYKKELEGIAAKDALGNPYPNSDAPGAVTTTVDKNLALTSNVAESSRLATTTAETQMVYLKSALNTMQATYSNPNTTAAQKVTLQATANAMFAGTGINGGKVVSGDATELTKVAKLSSKQLDGTYSVATKVIDPNENTYGKSNSFWNEDYYEKDIALRTQVEQAKLIQDVFNKDMKEQSAVVFDKVKYKYKDNPVKQLLAESMLNSVDGVYIRPLDTDRDVQAQAILFSNKYGDKVNGGKEAAYRYALDNAKSVAEDWKSNYYEYAKAFNNDPRYKYSNATESQAMVHKFDPIYNHDNNLVFQDVMRNFNQESKNVKVSFGDASVVREDDPIARRLLESLASNFDDNIGKSKNPSERRARGELSIQRIAAGDPNMMAFTIKNINQKFIDDNMSSSTKDRILPENDVEWQKGITVMIPKEFIRNQYYEDTKTDAWDYILAKQGKLTVKQPGAGEVNLTNAGDGTYNVTGNIIVKHGDGIESVRTVNKFMVRGPLDASTLVQTWNDNLMQMRLYNKAVLADARAQNGIKDPDKLLEQVMNNIKNPQ